MMWLATFLTKAMIFISSSESKVVLSLIPVVHAYLVKPENFLLMISLLKLFYNNLEWEALSIIV